MALIRSLLKVLSTFVKEQAILAKVPDGATLQSEAAPQPNHFFTSEHMIIHTACTLIEIPEVP